MRYKTFAFAVFLLPLTLFLDVILYALIKTCPSCGNFWDWVRNEGALSFPLIVMLTEWFETRISQFRRS